MENQSKLLHREMAVISEGVDAPEAAVPEVNPPTKPTIIVKVVRDNMEATLLLHPTGPNTLRPEREDLMEALAEKGIVYGVNEPLLDDLCVKPVYYHVFVIARGTPAMTGKDGYVQYLVSASTVRRPVIGEDGIADYKNTGFPPIVYKDQPLCEVHAPEKGDDGVDVLGNVLEGRFGREPMDPAGLNTVFNPERTVLRATNDGRIQILYGVISVVEVLSIDNNVDNATGNINFTGDVVVSGDVVSGFQIKCGGSIVVHGSVEGAVLEAGTDISVTAGMFGMDKGEISAGGSIKCRFIQNCAVRASGNIYADSILFSNVECGGDLELSGKKGALIGGCACVAGRVVAKTIGTSMHVPTEIRITPTGTEKDEEIAALEEEIEAMDDESLKIIQLLARFEDRNKKVRPKPEQIREVLLAKERYGRLVKEREDAESKLERIREEQKEAARQGCYIECKGQVHTNAKLVFGNEKLCVNESFSNSRIRVTEDGIAVSRL